MTIEDAVGLRHRVIQRAVHDTLHQATVVPDRFFRVDIHNALIQGTLDLLQRDLGGGTGKWPPPAPPLARRHDACLT